MAHSFPHSGMKLKRGVEFAMFRKLGVKYETVCLSATCLIVFLL